MRIGFSGRTCHSIVECNSKPLTAFETLVLMICYFVKLSMNVLTAHILIENMMERSKLIIYSLKRFLSCLRGLPFMSYVNAFSNSGIA